MVVREKCIKDEIYRMGKTFLNNQRETLKYPEESCLSAMEEYCRNELSARSLARILQSYHLQHPVTAKPAGCLTGIGLLAATACGFAYDVWVGVAGLALTIPTAMTVLRKPGRYDMARNQTIETWERAIEQARPKLEELLRKYES